jgi:ElaB/YqjD/DUF883 family membrane-anchored ribosome-binding protein
MQRKDANEMVSSLLARGRQQTEDMLKELERVLDQARGEVDTRTKRTRKRVEKRTSAARKQAERTARRVAKDVREAADEPLAQADKLRRRAGVGSSFPITGYDDLSVAQVKTRLAALSRPELRKVRTYEKSNKARKGILADIDKKLA